MRRYFLTGCTGFVGTALVREILRRPDTESICLMTRSAKKNEHFYRMDKKIILFEADILDGRFPQGGCFTDVIHGASPPMSGPFQHDISYTIVDGMRRILEWVNTEGVKSLLFISSGAASPSHPTPYGRAKHIAEGMLRFGKIARIFALIDETTPEQYAAGQFVREALDSGRVTVKGGENTYRSYLHTEDCARWLLRILDRGEQLIPYDVGGQEIYNIRALAELVAEIFSVPVVYEYKYEPAHAYLPYLGDAHAIGCKQTISLRQALERIRDQSIATT